VTQSPHPAVSLVKLIDLKPTQVAVGYREVNIKRQQWRDIMKSKGDKFLGQHSVPVVVGPKNKFYLIDHHHLCRALIEENVKEILIQKIQNLSFLNKQEFWHYMELKRWVYPYNENGVRVDYKDLPKDITKMMDDPYRALAGEARRQGAYAKEPTPFIEYAWANFLRTRIDIKSLKKDFNKSIELATKICQSKEARYLPGWCGLDPEA